MNPNASSPITRYAAPAPTRKITSSDPAPGADFAALLGAAPESGRSADARRPETPRHGSGRSAERSERDPASARDKAPKERDDMRGPSARGSEAPGRVTSLQARARAQVARDERLAEKAPSLAPTAPTASGPVLDSPAPALPVQAIVEEGTAQTATATLETAFDLTAAGLQSRLTAASAQTDVASTATPPAATAATPIPLPAGDAPARLAGAPGTTAVPGTDAAAAAAESLDAASAQVAGEQSVARAPLAPAQASVSTVPATAETTGAMPPGDASQDFAAVALPAAPDTAVAGAPDDLEPDAAPAQMIPGSSNAGTEAAATEGLATGSGTATGTGTGTGAGIGAAADPSDDAAASTTPLASESAAEVTEQATASHETPTSAHAATATTGAPVDAPAAEAAPEVTPDVTPADERLGQIPSGGAGSTGGDGGEGGEGGSPQPGRQDASPASATPITSSDESAPITGVQGSRQGEPLSAIPHRSVPLERAPRAVAQLLHVATQRGVTHARIALRPEELGGIEIHLQTSAAGLTAQVIADSPEAARLLTQASEELRRSLARHDLTLVSLDVSTSGERQQDFAASSGGWADAQSESRSNRAGRGVGDSGADDSVEPTTVAPSVIELPDGLLVDVLA